ncbi:recombinase family protein [Arthrobacter sp. UYCu723]
MGTAMLTIMAAFAQLERDTMIERTRAGLAVAAANNRHGGRPRKVDAAAAARANELKAKESAPPMSARCSESPAPWSTDTSYRRRADIWQSGNDMAKYWSEGEECRSGGAGSERNPRSRSSMSSGVSIVSPWFFCMCRLGWLVEK